MKFYHSVTKGSKLKVRKFWGLNSTFVGVTGEKLVEGTFLPPPSSGIGLKQKSNYENQKITLSASFRGCHFQPSLNSSSYSLKKNYSLEKKLCLKSMFTLDILNSNSYWYNNTTLIQRKTSINNRKLPDLLSFSY